MKNELRSWFWWFIIPGVIGGGICTADRRAAGFGSALTSSGMRLAEALNVGAGAGRRGRAALTH